MKYALLITRLPEGIVGNPTLKLYSCEHTEMYSQYRNYSLLIQWSHFGYLRKS